MRVRILLLPTVRIQRLTRGIGAVLSCSLSVSCSIPSPVQPQRAAAAPAASIHLSPSSSSLSNGEFSPRSSSPPAASHVRRSLSAFGRLERKAPAGGRTRCGGGPRASCRRDCRSGSKGGKVGSSGAGSSQSGGGGGGGGGRGACSGSGDRGSTRQHRQLHYG